MKTIIALTVLMMSSAIGFANTENHGVDPSKMVFKKWTKKSIAYPKESSQINEEGIVYISFDIREDGTGVNYSVDAGISTTLDQKALEIVMNMPKEHLYANGFIEGTRFVIPIKFSIQ